MTDKQVRFRRVEQGLAKSRVVQKSPKSSVTAGTGVTGVTGTCASTSVTSGMGTSTGMGTGTSMSVTSGLIIEEEPTQNPQCMHDNTQVSGIPRSVWTMPRDACGSRNITEHDTTSIASHAQTQGSTIMSMPLSTGISRSMGRPGTKYFPLIEAVRLGANDSHHANLIDAMSSLTQCTESEWIPFAYSYHMKCKESFTRVVGSKMSMSIVVPIILPKTQISLSIFGEDYSHPLLRKLQNIVVTITSRKHNYKAEFMNKECHFYLYGDSGMVLDTPFTIVYEAQVAEIALS